MIVPKKPQFNYSPEQLAWYPEARMITIKYFKINMKLINKGDY